MKHNRLLAVAHNYAASLSSGLGFVIGHHSSDVYEEAARQEDGFVEVDFLLGTIVRGACSEKFAETIKAYRAGFSEFCDRNQASKRDFAEFYAIYFIHNGARRYSVVVKDRSGKATAREYEAVSDARVKVLDSLGRIRPKPAADK